MRRVRQPARPPLRPRRAALLALILGLGLAGCVTPGSKVVETSQNALQAGGATMIHDWSAITFAAAPMGAPQELLLDDKAQILDDGKTRRYVRGYTLPAIDKPYSISLTSFRQGTPADPAILYPELIFLDANYQPLATGSQARFTYRSGGSNSADGLSAVVFVNSTHRGERHLVVTSRSLSEAELAKSAPNMVYSTPVTVPIRGGFLTWMIPQGQSQAPTRMIASPSGRLEISFDEYRMRKVGDKD